ncbi:MAG: cell division protein SepF [Fastidiosipilaceae bacterium]|jgi:cell division inhibitor SepF
MAGFFSNILSKFSNYDDEDPYDEYIEEETVEEPVRMETQQSSFRPQPRVVDFKATSGQQVVVVKPDSMASAQEVCHHLRAGRMVICNYEQVDQKVAQRVVDFISGSAYALDGKVHAVSSLIFVVIPRNVTMMDTNEQEESMDYVRRAAYGR